VKGEKKKGKGLSAIDFNSGGQAEKMMGGDVCPDVKSGTQ